MLFWFPVGIIPPSGPMAWSGLMKIHGKIHEAGFRCEPSCPVAYCKILLTSCQSLGCKGTGVSCPCPGVLVGTCPACHCWALALPWKSHCHLQIYTHTFSVWLKYFNDPFPRTTCSGSGHSTTKSELVSESSSIRKSRSWWSGIGNQQFRVSANNSNKFIIDIKIRWSCFQNIFMLKINELTKKKSSTANANCRVITLINYIVKILKLEKNLLSCE